METEKARLPEDVALNCGYLLSRLGFESRRRFTESIAHLGIRPAHYGVLAVLAESAPVAQTELAEALGADRGWLVGLLDELEAKGLVRRASDPRDRRRHAVSLTPEGKRCRREAGRIARRVEGELLRGLAPGEREHLRTLLRQMAP